MEPTILNITATEYAKLSPQRIEFIHRDKHYFNKIMFITGAVPSNFERLFGKWSFIWKGEYKCKCWAFSYSNMTFCVISANGRGTTMEAIYDIGRIANEPDKLKLISEFVEFITNKLLTLEDDKQIQDNKLFLNQK